MTRGGVPDAVQAHPVLGQGPGLVRTDDVCGPECLDGAEPLDQASTSREVGDADGQGERDRGQETLGHVGHQQTDGEDSGVRHAETGQHTEWQEGQSDPDRHRGDQPGHPSHLTLERAGLLCRSAAEPSDPAELGAHPGLDGDSEAVTGGARRPGEQHIGRVEESLCDLIAGLGSCSHDGHRLPGHRREVDLDGARQDLRIRADGVALAEHDEIAGHHRTCFDTVPASVPDDECVGRQVGAEGGHGVLGVALLEQRERRVESDDEQDGDPEGDRAGQKGQCRGQPEEQRERVDELPDQRGQQRRPPMDRQLVGAIAVETRVRLLIGQAVHRGAESYEHVRKRPHQERGLGGIHATTLIRRA